MESLLATNTCIGKARVACQRKGHAHACILTGSPTDLAGLVTYCHHAIADDLPPPALMCADMLHIRCTHTHGARHLVLTARLQAASLSTRGCIPTRMQRLQPYP